MGFIRRQTLIDRQTNTRDAKLFIVATEDTIDALRYFEAFNHISESRKSFSPSPVRVKSLPPIENRSAPTQLIKAVRDFVRRHRLDPRDEVWLVMDVDHWDRVALADVCRKAKVAGYGVAIANPCFEVWLCLHFAECGDDEITAAAQGRQAGANLKRLWRRYLPQSATDYWRGIIVPQAGEACVRALQGEHGNISETLPWPPAPGSRIHMLVKRILEELQK